MNIQRFKKSIDLFKNELEGALLSSDIWDKDSGLSIVSYNSNSKYAALFTQLTNTMNKNLEEIGFASFGAYQLIDLKDGNMLFLMNLEDQFLWGSLLEKSKLSLANLFYIAMPKAQNLLKQAINELK